MARRKTKAEKRAKRPGRRQREEAREVFVVNASRAKAELEYERALEAVSALAPTLGRTDPGGEPS